MTMRLNDKPKAFDERNKFDVANSNRASFKEFKQNLVNNPEPAPVSPLDGPRSKGGILETADVTEARLAMVAAKLDAQESAGRTARFNGIGQDEATVAALLDSWTRSTPSFLVTRHNMLSLGNAVTTYVGRAGLISIPILNDIFQHLIKENYLERSRGSRVRGQNGIMVSGTVRMYPEFKSPEDKQAEATQVALAGVGNRAAEDKANRELSMSELAAKARASYKPNPRGIRVI
jgi:hypothetical protein